MQNPSLTITHSINCQGLSSSNSQEKTNYPMLVPIQVLENILLEMMHEGIHIEVR